MWRRIQILSPIQSLIVASLSAASIAIPLALLAIPHDETAFVRNLFWPYTLTPYITFAIVFIGVLPALLGYYHLGRLGFGLNVAAGFALIWVMAVCGMLCFVVVGHYFGSILLSAVTFAACIALAYVFIARLHLKVARSASVRDAQRKLHLLPTGTL